MEEIKEYNINGLIFTKQQLESFISYSNNSNLELIYSLYKDEFICRKLLYSAQISQSLYEQIYKDNKNNLNICEVIENSGEFKTKLDYIYKEIANNEILFKNKLEHYLKFNDYSSLTNLIYKNNNFIKLLETNDYNIQILAIIAKMGNRNKSDSLRSVAKQTSVENLYKLFSFLESSDSLSNAYLYLEFMIGCKNINDDLIDKLFKIFRNEPYNLNNFLKYENLSADKITHIYKKNEI